jgi:hypothetical protein
VGKHGGGFVMVGGYDPQLPSLSEADCAEMEAFLDEMLLIFPVLGVYVFVKPSERPKSSHLLFLRAKGITAKGYESAEG